MKSRNEMRKPVRETGSEERKTRKLKPVPKQKNMKQSLFKEIDDLEDIDMGYHNEMEDSDLYDEEIDDE